MSVFYITLIASDHSLTAGHLAKVEGVLDDAAIRMTGQPVWLSPNRAADIPVADLLTLDQMDLLRELLAGDKIDVTCTAASDRRKKLLMADMDSTIVVDETLDELAGYAGLKDKIAAITARAMNGELDFETALRERVGLLSGLSQTFVDDTVQKTELTDGAKALVKTMKACGATCVLISGGFTVFTEYVAGLCGFDHNFGNRLEIANGALTGQVIDPILTKDTKQAMLEKYTLELGLSESQTLAVGDGANDLNMLQTAGLGIGFHPKPLLKQSLLNYIEYGDLTALLYAQGYQDNEILHG